MRRITTVLLLIILVFLLSVPVVAAQNPVNVYANFPTTGPQYSGTYKAQTVAVQRFLMSINSYNQSRLSQNGGTDGLFGAMTADITKEYWTANGLSADDIVGPATWAQIGTELTEVGVDSIGPVIYHNRKDILIVGSDSYGVGYMAVTDKRTVTSIFYYTSKY